VHRLDKGWHTCTSDRVVLAERYQHSNAANSLGLLRTPGERPCRRGERHRDKCAAPHSGTPSGHEQASPEHSRAEAVAQADNLAVALAIQNN
jgi:hypothetical protein